MEMENGSKMMSVRVRKEERKGDSREKEYIYKKSKGNLNKVKNGKEIRVKGQRRSGRE